MCQICGANEASETVYWRGDGVLDLCEDCILRIDKRYVERRETKQKEEK